MLFNGSNYKNVLFNGDEILKLLSAIPNTNASTTIPRLIFTFDDAYDSVYSKAFPYMQVKGIKGTMYAVPSLIDTVNFCTKENLDDMYNAEWCIANHTYNHAYMALSTKSEALIEIGDAIVWLENNGYLTGVKHLCYPGGQYNDDVILAAKELGVKTGRTTIEGANGQVIPYMFELNTFGAGGGLNELAAIQSAITSAITNGTTLILMFHRIVDTVGEVGTDGMNFLKADFETLCDFVVTSGISTMTIDEWYNTLAFKATEIAFGATPHGKNYFDLTTVVDGRLDNGVLGFASDASHTITLDSMTVTTTVAFRGVTLDFVAIPQLDMTISVGAGDKSDDIVIEYYDASYTYISKLNAFNGTVKAFTAPSNTVYVRIWFVFNSAITATLNNIQLEAGLSATAYERFSD